MESNLSGRSEAKAKIDLVELEQILKDYRALIEFGIVALISNAIGDSAYTSLVTSAFPVAQATIAKWVVFGFCLLVYYKLIRIHVRKEI